MPNPAANGSTSRATPRAARADRRWARAWTARSDGGWPSARRRAPDRTRRPHAWRTRRPPGRAVPAPERIHERGQLARGVTQVAVAEHDDRLVSAYLFKCRHAPPRSSPGPCRSRARCAPRWRRPPRASSGVASVEPSSASHTGAPGKATASAASVQEMRSASSKAATTMRMSVFIGGVGSRGYCPQPFSAIEAHGDDGARRITRRSIS